MGLQRHWDRIHGSRQDQQLSWFEPMPWVSVRLLEAAGLGADSCVLDVGGAAVIATFSPEGPEKCSGEELTLVESVRHGHPTPWGVMQAFQYSRFIRR